jgi:hypothetical protein
MRKMRKHSSVPPTSLLMIDLDFVPYKSWLKHYRPKVQLALQSYGMKARSIKITSSNHKGYHVRIYLDKPVPARLANLLQWLLCDDAARVGFNQARINIGFDEWNKLFEAPRK